MELISREEVKKLAEHLHWVHYEDSITEYDILDGLKEIPTIESRPKGRWVEGLDERGFYNKCSVCGYDNIESYFHRKSDMNFCPNCGADMRGKE